jgi:hypothetical protein|tara:strand:- start:145 stop:363 length:219 start_codon:yes stop_codon:yes gene_type:complete
MHIEETTKQEVAKETISPFEEVKDMNYTAAVNILIQAGNAAQGAGALSIRDAVLLASAAEFLTSNKTTSEKA